MKTKQFAALLLAVLMLFAGCAKAPEETTTEAAPQTNYGENDVTALSDYSVKTASPDDDVMNAVIAVNDKDEPVYTNRFLQFSFWMEFYSFMNSYGSYASQLGLDTATPLNKQNSLAENRTWEQYMLESATENLADSYALAQAAAANGYQLSEENEQMIASITDDNGEFIQEAKNNGYDTADAYLQANFGGGVDAKTYQDYMRLYYTSYDYSATLREEIGATITDADVEAEYDANAASYQDDGVLKVNNVSVRHVLIQPEGDKDTTTGDWMRSSGLRPRRRPTSFMRHGRATRPRMPLPPWPRRTPPTAARTRTAASMRTSSPARRSRNSTTGASIRAASPAIPALSRRISATTSCISSARPRPRRGWRPSATSWCRPS